MTKLIEYRIPHTEAVTGLHEPLTACIAAYWHDGEARKMTHRLKYGADHSAAIVLAQGMACALAECASELIAETTVVVPVPLHIRRERERGYNQAYLLAKSLCEHTGLQLVPDALQRTYYTKSQTEQSREERLQSMRTAFEVATPWVLHQKRVLLIDDVLTTGGTAIACANAMLMAGASEVYLLTACRAEQ